jgi:hypothetical protein
MYAMVVVFISVRMFSTGYIEDLASKRVFWGHYNNIDKEIRPEFAKKLGQSEFHKICMRETYKLFGIDMSKLLEDKKQKMLQLLIWENKLILI